MMMTAAVPRLLLLLLLLLQLSLAFAYHSLVVAFRQPSRHTVGFQTPTAAGGCASPPYALPLVEFILAATGRAGGFGEGLMFQPMVPSAPFYRLESSGQCQQEQLAAVARRCVLTYGLFELLARGTGGGREEAALDAAAVQVPPSFSSDSVTWRVGVVTVPIDNDDDDVAGEAKEATAAASRCLGLEEQAAVLQHFDLGLDTARHVRDERVPVEMDLFVFLLEPRARGSRSSTTTTTALLCRRLARGPAIGTGYSYATTARRPRGGLLGLMSEHARRRDGAARTPTAMEPELGLLMNNLASVKPGARVLDPFCGGGSLLLAANILGATVLVGTDAAVELLGNKEARAAVLRGFDELDASAVAASLLAESGGAGSEAVLSPRLGLADIRAFREHPEFFVPRGFDAVVTDPPYDIKEKVRRMGAESAAHDNDDADADANAVVETKRAKALAAVAALLEAAAVTLAPGGRLVFFLPAWGPHGLGVGPSKRKTRRGRGRSSSSKGVSVGGPDARTTEEMMPAVTAAALLRRWHERLLREQPLMRTLPPGLSLITVQPQVFSPNFLRWLVCIEKAAE